MDNFSCFLKSNNLQDYAYACFAGTAVLYAFDDVEAYFSTMSGANIHFIFAKPFMRQNRDKAAEVVSWYSREHGNAMRWGELDEITQLRVGQELQFQWQHILAIFAGSPLLPIVERWFNIVDIEQDLLLVANRPILTNWGLLPKTIVDNENARINHFNEGLGQIINIRAVLPFGNDDRDLSAPWIGGQTVAANDGNPHDGANISGNGQNNASNESTREAQINNARHYVRGVAVKSGFLLPLIASAVLLFLIVLLLLVYFLPSGNLGVRVSSSEKSEAIALLESRRDALKNGLSGFSCPMPAPNSQSADRGGASGAAGENRGDGVISAIDPNQPLPDISGALVVPSSGPIAHAENATVLIMVEDDSEEGGSMGSGFFINETDILTNLHVVGNAQNVKIINKALGKTIDAKVVARSRGEAQIGAPDFAVLRISSGRAPAVLAIGGKTAKGENVIAAGFPGIIMETDSVFHRLLRGDATAAPEMAVTQGMVTTFQQGIEGLELMLHTAAISGGNSGGPLIDYCGRAVGVNTFLRSGGAENSPLSFAQRTSTLTSFLKRANVAYKFEDNQCQPQGIQQQPQAAGALSAPESTNAPSAPEAAPAANSQVAPSSPQAGASATPSGIGANMPPATPPTSPPTSTPSAADPAASGSTSPNSSSNGAPSTGSSSAPSAVLSTAPANGNQQSNQRPNQQSGQHSNQQGNAQ